MKSFAAWANGSQSALITTTCSNHCCRILMRHLRPRFYNSFSFFFRGPRARATSAGTAGKRTERSSSRPTNPTYTYIDGEKKKRYYSFIRRRMKSGSKTRERRERKERRTKRNEFIIHSLREMRDI